MNKSEIKQFLGECVYYPCSGIDGAPVKFLGKRFRKFFFSDYSVKRESLEDACRRLGFHGYECKSLVDLPTMSVYGSNWEAIKREHEHLSERLTWGFEPENEFVVLAKFERLPDFDDQHGVEEFSLMFARCESIAAYEAAFTGNGISPACLCYIRPGIGFGGCFSGFPAALTKAIQKNPAGLPPYLLIDGMGTSRECGDYFRLVQKYEPMVSFQYDTEGYGNGKLTFAIRS